MIEHTPGPWGFEDDVNKHLITAGLDEGGCIIYVADPSFSDTEGLDKANARLIATAPDLLRELEDVKARIEESEEWWIDDPDLGGFDLEAIDAAIAKAKGA